MKRIFACILMLTLLLTGCAGTSLPDDTPSSSVPTPSHTPSSSDPSSEAEPPVSSDTSSTTTSQEPDSSEPVTSAPTSSKPTVNKSIEQILADMTIEEKVGQLFLARCPSNAAAVTDVQTYHLGGYILFGRDFKNSTPAKVKTTIADYQSAAEVPLLIAVDEEGGTVTRVSYYSQYRASKFRAPRDLYNQGGLNLILKTEKEKCTLLTSLGINVNMAPVCDITTDSASFMYKRSLGQSPAETARFIRSVVDVMADYDVGSVLKHFPGYGNNTDTHVGIAVDNRTLDELEAVDLVPFAAGIDAGCGAILVSHTFVNCMDKTYPASLSPAVHDYLRREMDFDGVIVTDDLVMQAITNLYGAGESAVLAVLAGNDLLCSSEYKVQYKAVLEAAKTGRIPASLLNAAVRRVLRWKKQLGLLG